MVIDVTRNEIAERFDDLPKLQLDRDPSTKSNVDKTSSKLGTVEKPTISGIEQCANQELIMAEQISDRAKSSSQSATTYLVFLSDDGPFRPRERRFA